MKIFPRQWSSVRVPPAVEHLRSTAYRRPIRNLFRPYGLYAARTASVHRGYAATGVADGECCQACIAVTFALSGKFQLVQADLNKSDEQRHFRLSNNEAFDFMHVLNLYRALSSITVLQWICWTTRILLSECRGVVERHDDQQDKIAKAICGN